MKEPFDEYRNCTIINKEVNVTGFWDIHKSRTTAIPKIDKITLVKFNCDHISVCSPKQDCPL